MTDKEFSWHGEYYDRAVKEIGGTAGKKYYQFLNEHEEPEIGWLEWFIKEHPEPYKKYETALIQINALWGDMSPEKMEEFKKAVKVEVDATKWAVEKYLEWQAGLADRKKQPTCQEKMVI